MRRAPGIRPYRPDDAGAVADLWHRAGREAYDFIPTWQAFTREHAREVFPKAVVEGRELWVAVEDERPVGYLALDGGYVDRLYVDPPAQGRGIGSALLEHARALHPDGLELVTHQANRRARAFYERHGFVPVAFGTSPAPESIPDVRYRWTPPDAPPPEPVRHLIEVLTRELDALFGDELVGLYLRGSLATGDFLPETSDVDVFAIPEHAVDAERFAALEALHERVARASPSHGHRLEIAYVHRAAARRFEPGHRHPTLGQGERIAWQHHPVQWRIERAVLHDCGVPLRGPHPSDLIDPVSPADVRRAVRERLCQWVAWAADPDNPEWRLPAWQKAYTVESTCRALHTLECGRLGSKMRAVGWALDVLPEPHRTTVARSQTWRRERGVGLELVPEVRRFVAFAGARAGTEVT
jgi:ribosomal protein S18 acetylase RimI-like enzyme/predicted nucleotidyltransferase